MKARLFSVAFTGAALAAGGANMGSDAAITTSVKMRFIEDHSVNALDIKVNTFKGEVQLSGLAHSPYEIERAGAIARSVDGVKYVRNDIHLQ
jgi:osmotically-inducible protein OsmY